MASCGGASGVDHHRFLWPCDDIDVGRFSESIAFHNHGAALGELGQEEGPRPFHSFDLCGHKPCLGGPREPKMGEISFEIGFSSEPSLVFGLIKGYI